MRKFTYFKLATITATSCLALLASTANAKDAPALTIKNFIGTIDVQTGDYDEITVTDADGSPVDQQSNGVTIDGEQIIKNINCRKSKASIKISGGSRKWKKRKGDYKNLNEYPKLKITAPEDTHLVIDNAVIFGDVEDIGSADDQISTDEQPSTDDQISTAEQPPADDQPSTDEQPPANKKEADAAVKAVNSEYEALLAKFHTDTANADSLGKKYLAAQFLVDLRAMYRKRGVELAASRPDPTEQRYLDVYTGSVNTERTQYSDAVEVDNAIKIGTFGDLSPRLQKKFFQKNDEWIANVAQEAVDRGEITPEEVESFKHGIREKTWLHVGMVPKTYADMYSGITAMDLTGTPTEADLTRLQSVVDIYDRLYKENPVVAASALDEEGRIRVDAIIAVTGPDGDTREAIKAHIGSLAKPGGRPLPSPVIDASDKRQIKRNVEGHFRGLGFTGFSGIQTESRMTESEAYYATAIGKRDARRLAEANEARKARDAEQVNLFGQYKLGFNENIYTGFKRKFDDEHAPLLERFRREGKLPSQRHPLHPSWEFKDDDSPEIRARKEQRRDWQENDDRMYTYVHAAFGATGEGFDPDYDKHKHRDELTKGIPQPYVSDIMDHTNLAAAERERERVLDRLENQWKIAQQYSGGIARFFAMFADIILVFASLVLLVLVISLRVTCKVSKSHLPDPETYKSAM